VTSETPPNKEEKAHINAEALIRDDDTVEASEILGLTCQLLSEQISLISHSKECPSDLVSSTSILLWASHVVDIPELIEIRKQFRYKWGKQFEADALQNVGGGINKRVTAKLSVLPLSAYLVQTYLEKIADEHKVKWKPKKILSVETMAEPILPPEGYSVQVRGGSGLNTG
jgi:vacuolar protein sorting-associated protein IST1